MGAPLVALVGPTAVGKTGLCLEMCQRLGAEVVSADSVQVYRGLDIGSAKPSPAELAQAPHHLIDVAEPGEDFDAARFVALADAAIADIGGRGRRALISGGTGLYLKALLHGLAPAPPVDQELRLRLRADWDRQGPQALHDRLAALDPVAAGRLHRNDRQRVLRALEVCLQTGRPWSQGQDRHGFQGRRYPHLVVVLDRPREELAQRIAQRARVMWEGGLLDEVAGLLAAGVAPDAKSLQTLGYRQAVLFLQGRLERREALEEMIRQTRAYAKRQLTWFRGLDGAVWRHPERTEDIMALARAFWEKNNP